MPTVADERDAIDERYAARAPLGRLNGIQPDIGTIVGPGDDGFLGVVIGVDDRGAIIGQATSADQMDALVGDQVRSLYEHRQRMLPRA